MSNYQFTKPAGPFRLFELAKISGATLYEGKGETFTVSGLAKLSEATSNDLVMLHQKIRQRIKAYSCSCLYHRARLCEICP